MQEFLINVSKGLNARLELDKLDEKEQMDLANKHQKKIQFWTRECIEVLNLFYNVFLSFVVLLSCCRKYI